MRISDLFIYPLKSARGIAMSSAAVDAFGLIGDRRMMITDPAGHGITQRELQELAQIDVEPGLTSTRLKMQGKADIVVPTPQPERRMEVDIWRSVISAAVAEDGANRQLSEWLGREVKLVFFDGLARRVANPEWASGDTPVTFSDGYQILVTTSGSLEALNGNLAIHGEGSVGMERFRPNIVIDCDEEWSEDRWAAIEIAGIRLDFVKPCARCIMTTQDQTTGSRHVPNPMPAMGRIRMSADRRVPGPLFGWNAVPRGAGTVAIGDEVTVVKARPEGWAFKARRA
jgi:uncharacterized protein YcbX